MTKGTQRGFTESNTTLPATAVVLGGAAAALGVILPWVRVSFSVPGVNVVNRGVSGLDSVQGKALLVCGGLMMLVGAMLWSPEERRRRLLAVAGLIPAVVGIFFALHDISTIEQTRVRPAVRDGLSQAYEIKNGHKPTAAQLEHLRQGAKVAYSLEFGLQVIVGGAAAGIAGALAGTVFPIRRRRIPISKMERPYGYAVAGEGWQVAPPNFPSDGPLSRTGTGDSRGRPRPAPPAPLRRPEPPASTTR